MVFDFGAALGAHFGENAGAVIVVQRCGEEFASDSIIDASLFDEVTLPDLYDFPMHFFLGAKLQSGGSLVHLRFNFSAQGLKLRDGFEISIVNLSGFVACTSWQGSNRNGFRANPLAAAELRVSRGLEEERT